MPITELLRSGLSRLRHRLNSPARPAPPLLNPAQQAAEATTRQALQQQLRISDRLVVFVRYEQGDDLPSCQAAFLADLARLGWTVWIVDNSPVPLVHAARERCRCGIYWQRPNSGMCIGAYAHAIALLEQVLADNADLHPPTLALINNSFLPLLPPSANSILNELFHRPIGADHFRGLTEAREQAYHLQSFLLILGSRAWQSEPARLFWQQCRQLRQREQIISHGEVALTGVLLRAGLHSEVMLPLSSLAALGQTRVGIQDHHPVSPIEHNPYLVYWKEVLQLSGIIKKSALNNASQSRTAGATLAEFLQVAGSTGLPGAESAIDWLVRH